MRAADMQHGWRRSSYDHLLAGWRQRWLCIGGHYGSQYEMSAGNRCGLHRYSRRLWRRDVARALPQNRATAGWAGWVRLRSNGSAILRCEPNKRITGLCTLYVLNRARHRVCMLVSPMVVAMANCC